MKIAKLLAAGIAISAINTASAGDQNTTTVWTVDYSGKPPYQRKAETLPTADIAMFETQQTTEVVTTDFSGKPPYKRNREIVRVVDLAQFEAVEEKKFVPTPRRAKYAHHR